MKKECSKCKEEKTLDLFDKRKASPDGYRQFCKECKLNYNRSRKGLIFCIYSDQKSNSRNRGHVPPRYTRNQFKTFAISSDKFNSIYKDWVQSGFKKDLKPSFDRKNNNLPYSFNNLRIVTWIENQQKAWSDMREGIIIHGNKPQIKVNQLDSKGKVVNSFVSLSQAQRVTGVKLTNISKVINGLRKNAGGFGWSKIK